ncbi:octopamine receptor-like [Argonauta hians]
MSNFSDLYNSSTLSQYSAIFDIPLSNHIKNICNLSSNQSFSDEFLQYSRDCDGFPEFRNVSVDIRVKIERQFWEQCLICFVLSMIAVSATIGNILIILAVWRCRRLRTVTNCYVVSLATADLLVSILVLPLSITVEVTGRWLFNDLLCDLWISSDVLLCTASILNLCCISLDRYFAITKPLLYSTRRSKRSAILMVAIAWALAFVITCPPVLGWKEEGRDLSNGCSLTRDPGYIIYSASGSFFIPLIVMLFVYARIYHVARKREKRLRPYWRSFLHSRTKRCDSENSDNMSPPNEASETRLTRPGSSADVEYKCEVTASNTNNESNVFSSVNKELHNLSMNNRFEKLRPVQETRSNYILTSIAENTLTQPTCLKESTDRSSDNLVVYQTGSNCSIKPADVGETTYHKASQESCEFFSSKIGSNLQKSELNPAFSYKTVKYASNNKLNSDGNLSSDCEHQIPEKKRSYSTQFSPNTFSSGKHTKRFQSSMRTFKNQSYKNISKYKSSNAPRFNRVSMNQNRSSLRQQKVERSFYLKERKTAKTLAIVVGCFIICWLPFFLVYVIDVFCTSCNITPTLLSIITWLGYVNSTLNPLIYAMYNTTFRTAFWNLTVGLCFAKTR